MNVEKTPFEGLYVISNFYAEDVRGAFCKTYNKEFFNAYGIDFEIRESFYSISRKGVIRGMHFQLPPFDHNKLVYVPAGKIMDVVIDLRKSSTTYLKFYSIELSSDNKKSLFIPTGFAHGFKSLQDHTITLYNTSSEYNPNFDTGVLYDSFDFKWNEQAPSLSERDMMFPTVSDFCSNNPFE